MLELHTYYRSSSAYRVRIALHLKGLQYTSRYVHLLHDEHRQTGYLHLNPQGMVPTLVDGPAVVTQSLAILEYLDEVYPQPPLLPASPVDRAWVRSLALLIAADIQPLSNLRVQRYLNGVAQLDETLRSAWIGHWIREGFAAMEARLAGDSRRGRCCYGESPGLADLCLVPQVYNARRYACDLDAFPLITRIAGHCANLPAFRAAAPDNQEDAE